MKIKENSICIVFDFASEKARRTKEFKHIPMPNLMELMVEYLEINTPPIKSKEKLKEGIELFTSIRNKAVTIELREIANGYVHMYHKEYVNK